MKKLLFPFLILTMALCVQSCSEDFDIAAPYKQYTVVYGVLDMKDTAHYIRIQKSFLDETKNAFDMAKVSDSNFYKESELEVMIKEISGGAAIGEPIVLKRVDMNLEGYPKDSGAFFTSPNYGYKFTKPLNSNYQYRLVINNLANHTMDSADIELVDTTRFTFRSEIPALNFATTSTNFSGAVFQIYVVPGTAKYVEGVVRFRWVERPVAVTTGGMHDSADFVFAQLSTKDEVASGKLSVENVRFYNFLNSAMGPAPEGIGRYMDSVDIIIYGAGPEYADYLKTAELQSSGLSGDQIKPLYTNIRGNDVFGLFTSKTSKVLKNRFITSATIDSLRLSTRTKALNIQGYYKP